MRCPDCSDTGWVHGVKVVKRAGVEPYEAEFSRRCEKCAAAPQQAGGMSTVTGAGMKRLFGNLSLLNFFPADEESRLALAAQIERFATTDEQLDWLGDRAVMVFREWPGPMELRAFFIKKFPPKDGITAVSEIFPDGFPPEKPEPRLALPPGVEVREDPKEKEASIRALVEEIERKRVERKQRVPDIKAPVVTEADTERIKEQQRQNQARRKSLEDGDADPTTEG
jgi:hypothetical protein